MISFFKYVESGVFTNNSNPYSGMVNVVGNNVYTGSKFTSNSVILSASNKVLAQVIKNRIDIGSSYDKKIQLKRANILQRDILNLNTITNITDALNTNNLRIFANQITYNPDVFNNLKRTQDQLTYTYCLTSTGDIFTGKKIPLSRVSADNTDYIKVRNPSRDNSTLFFTGLSGTFSYYASGSVMRFNLNSPDAPKITEGLEITPTFDHTFLKFNQYSNKIYYNTLDNCIVYNFNYGNQGNQISISDKFDISNINTLTDRRNSTYGLNYRAALVQLQGSLILEISYIDSQDLIATYTSSDLGFGNIYRVVQRFEDDILIVVVIIGGVIYKKVYDISELIKGNKEIYSNKLLQCEVNDVFELAPFDSNILIVRRYNSEGTLDHLEFRSIDNSAYPLVRFSSTSQLGLVRDNQIINEQYINIENYNLVLLQTNAQSNNNIIHDIQFSVSETLNAIILLNDSFSIVNNNTFLQLVQLDLEKEFIQVDIHDNSIGLNLNNTIKPIVFDTIKLYLNCSEKYNFDRLSGSVKGTIPLPQESVIMDDLYFYENENINVGIINRIINSLYNYQEKLVANIYGPFSQDLISIIDSTFNITVENDGVANVFVINGVRKPTLNLVRNQVYTFDQSDPSNATHKVAFKTGSGELYTTGVVSIGIPGQLGAKTVITVPFDAPNDLRYYCVSHGDYMGNIITISGGNPSNSSANGSSIIGDSSVTNSASGSSASSSSSSSSGGYGY